MNERVVVTGCGAISALGGDVASLISGLNAARSGVAPLNTPWISRLASPLAAAVTVPVEDQFTKLRRLTLDRVAQLSLLSSGQAIAQSGLKFEGEMAEACGIYWGTGMGGANTLEQAWLETATNPDARVRPTAIVMFMANSSTGQIGIEHKILGPSYTFSSACSSSAVAIGEAFRNIASGRIRYAIAGGSEALLTLGVMKAWESLQTLARPDKDHPETSCRPFSKDRSGFVLGEGSAAVMLEAESSARARGAKILGEIVGYGNSTDATHITQPDSNGQARAMRQALKEAGLDPSQVGYINAHGTGTAVGDVVETRAIHQVFGAAAGSVAVSSTKALTGHLMGASGALEMVVALSALESGIVPPTAHLTNPDPECDLDYVAEGARHIPNLDVVMNNSFGFGGNNAVIIARRYR
jgi:3-oxoacyl-[acyl-carrier-protein] synthase II